MCKQIKAVKAGSRTLYSLIKFRLTGKPTPVCVIFQITKHCNLHCVYCYANKEALKDVPDLTYEEFTGLVDQIYTLGGRWIRFLGGEPLMRNDIGKMIRYANDKGMMTEMNTNGYFMEGKTNNLRELDSLVISIDGTKETNDKCRGQGSYDKAINAIELAKNIGIPMRLHGCLSCYHTIDDINHLAELSEKYDVAFNFSAPSPIYFEDDKRMSCHPSQEQVAMIHQRCIELKAEGYNITTTNAGAKYVKKWPGKRDVLTKEDNPPKGSYVPCVNGKLFCTIDVDGNVYPCAGYWRDGVNAKQIGFRYAWEHLHHLPCLSCNYSANIELSLLFRLSPRAIKEVLIYLFKRIGL